MGRPLDKLLNYAFVSNLGEKNLLTYKYHGSDASLLYKHVYSPMAQKLVDMAIPTWLAPNVITLIGLFATLIPHLILWYTHDTLSGEVPAWLCYLCAFGQFLYIIFDNADGKQARKTGNSSPLGLLFDHGCDAVNTFIAGMNLLIVVQFGNSVFSTIAYIVAVIPFYMATWEEYYTDHLALPFINGPNEGITGVIGLYILSGVFGNNIWIQEIHGIPINVYMLVFFNFLGVANSLTHIMSVKKHTKGRSLKAFSDLTMLVYIIATTLIVSCLSPTNVISRTARPIIYFVGLSFSKLMGHLQVSHVTSSKFEQFDPMVVIPFTLLNINTLIGFFTGKPLINEDLLIYILVTFALMAYTHFATNVVKQFSRVLNIHVFKTGKRESVRKE